MSDPFVTLHRTKLLAVRVTRLRELLNRDRNRRNCDRGRTYLGGCRSSLSLLLPQKSLVLALHGPRNTHRERVTAGAATETAPDVKMRTCCRIRPQRYSLGFAFAARFS